MIKRIFIFSVAIFLLFISACLNSLNAAQIYVNPGEGIQKAIDSANPNDDVIVRSGVYYENIVMKDNVDLIGENAVIVGKSEGYTVNYTVIGANATLTGFKIKSITTPPRSPEVIFVDGKNTIIENNILEGMLSLRNGNFIVTNNIFRSAGGIAISQLYQPFGLSIVKNNLVLMKDGFQFEASAGGQIIVENNTLVGDGTGIGIYIGYGQIIVRNNIITNFGIGFSASSNNFGLHTYNLFWKNKHNYSEYLSGGYGEIIADPLFEKGTGPYGDYYLSQRGSKVSPAVNAGDPAVLPYGTTDKNRKPDKHRADIGYHYSINK